MKKLLLLLICLQIFSLQTLAKENLISDEFVENTLVKKKLRAVKRAPVVIEDELLDDKFYKSVKPIKVKNITIIDDYVLETLSNKKLEKPLVSLNQDFLNIISHPIEIKSSQIINTKNDPIEGSIVKFHTTKKITLPNGIELPSGTEILGRVETVSQNNTTGTPADIIIGNFKAGKTRLSGRIEKTGANRVLWVFPIYAIASNATIFAAPLMLAYFIRGGHAKITPEQTYVIYYHNSH